MKLSYCLLFALISLFVASCSVQDHHGTVSKQVAEDELLRFAKANCFFWYFKKMNYDLEDIRGISGDIVETGSYSAPRYGRVSLLVKNYAPEISTKQEIDVDLLKCFELERDDEFLSSLEEIKHATINMDEY